jgi:hypothetical protein
VDLAAPPDPDARYEVAIRDLTGRDAWRQSVAGAAFLQTYSLALVLPACVLKPGRYELTVRDPDGRQMLRADLALR